MSRPLKLHTDGPLALNNQMLFTDYMSSNLKSFLKNVNVHSGQISNIDSIYAKIMFFSIITTAILSHKEY